VFEDDFETFDETLLTNFDVKELSHYEKALLIHGDKTLYIDSGAFDNLGRRLPDCLALRTTLPGKDRSDFWDIFDTLKKRYRR